MRDVVVVIHARRDRATSSLPPVAVYHPCHNIANVADNMSAQIPFPTIAITATSSNEQRFGNVYEHYYIRPIRAFRHSVSSPSCESDSPACGSLAQPVMLHIWCGLINCDHFLCARRTQPCATIIVLTACATHCHCTCDEQVSTLVATVALQNDTINAQNAVIQAQCAAVA